MGTWLTDSGFDQAAVGTHCQGVNGQLVILHVCSDLKMNTCFTIKKVKTHSNAVVFRCKSFIL